MAIKVGSITVEIKPDFSQLINHSLWLALTLFVETRQTNFKVLASITLTWWWWLKSEIVRLNCSLQFYFIHQHFGCLLLPNPSHTQREKKRLTNRCRVIYLLFCDLLKIIHTFEGLTLECSSIVQTHLNRVKIGNDLPPTNFNFFRNVQHNLILLKLHMKCNTQFGTLSSLLVLNSLKWFK